MFHVKHFNISQEKAIKLERYVDLLLKWNKRVNLIGRDDEEWIWGYLIYPVYLVSRRVKNGNLIDLGAGAGIGGVVLKILNDPLKVLLAERRQKKCSFLRFIKMELNLDYNVECINVSPGIFTGFDYLFLRGVKLEGWHRDVAKNIIYFGKVPEDWIIKEEIEWEKGRIYILKGM